MTVAAVVVTYRSDQALPGLLESLEQHEPDTPVVIVDSGSPGGPPDVPGRVRLVALEENVGFGAACNAGVRAAADADFYAFLNPDVRLRGPSLSELARELAARPDVGIATGPILDPSGLRVASAWGPASPARAFWFATGWRLPRLRAALGRWRTGGSMTSAASTSREEVEVDGHVLGGAMVVARRCFEELHGFDESFFLYWEDADLCRRARDAGWELRMLPCTPIVHDAGTSSTGVAADQRWRWYVDGARHFAEKHLDEGQRRRLMAALRWGRRLRRQ